MIHRPWGRDRPDETRCGQLGFVTHHAPPDDSSIVRRLFIDRIRDRLRSILETLQRLFPFVNSFRRAIQLHRLLRHDIVQHIKLPLQMRQCGFQFDDPLLFAFHSYVIP